MNLYTWYCFYRCVNVSDKPSCTKKKEGCIGKSYWQNGIWSNPIHSERESFLPSGPEDQLLYIANDTEIHSFVYPFHQSHGHELVASIEDSARIIGMDALYQRHTFVWATQFNPGGIFYRDIQEHSLSNSGIVVSMKWAHFSTFSGVSVLLLVLVSGLVVQGSSKPVVPKLCTVP